ncbi:acyl-CoA dehydrogenase NM domain-like protein [Hortaea werneckii]|nr:acyl-CoA dehydrogenase NM domain-like protein [Hortaea werneckii]
MLPERPIRREDIVSLAGSQSTMSPLTDNPIIEFSRQNRFDIRRFDREIVVQRVHASLASREDLVHAVQTPGPLLVLGLVDGFAAVGSGEAPKSGLRLPRAEEEIIMSYLEMVSLEIVLWVENRLGMVKNSEANIMLGLHLDTSEGGAGQPWPCWRSHSYQLLEQNGVALTPNMQYTYLHAQRLMDTKSLPYAQIEHDFLATTGDSIGSHIPVETRNLVVRHLLALEDQALHPRIRGFDLSGHMRQLHTDDRMVDELLAKRPPLVRILHALLVADSRESQALDDDSDALVVEVGHDDLEPLVLFADEVLDWHLDVFERDVGSAGGPDALAVHAARAHAAHTALDEEDGDAVHAFASGTHGSCEVVTPTIR